MVLTEPEKLDLPYIELSDRRNIVLKHCYLLLGEGWLEYKNACSYESGDLETGEWENKIENWTICIKKSSILSVDLFFDNNFGKWVISIYVPSHEGLCWHFQEKKEAAGTYNRLRDYLVTT